MIYHIVENDVHNVIRQQTDDGTVLWIPLDAANTDYQRYLEWVAAGGIPEPWQP